MGFECSGCVFVLLRIFFGFFPNLKVLYVAVMSQRSGEAPKLRPTQEVHYAVSLSSVPHKIEFLR